MLDRDRMVAILSERIAEPCFYLRPSALAIGLLAKVEAGSACMKAARGGKGRFAVGSADRPELVVVVEVVQN